MNEDIDGLDRDMAAQFRIMQAAQEELKVLRELRDEALDAHLATLTVGQIMGDEKVLRRVLNESFHHSGASRLMRALYKTGRKDVVAEGVERRDELKGAPALQVRLSYRQPVDEVAAAMRRWAATWALGRATLAVGILEHTLSRWASYSLLWDLATDRAVLRSNGYRELREGPLEEILAAVAEDYWLEGGPRSDHDDYS